MKQSGVTVTEAIVKKMMKGNEAEIELANLAQDKTSNDELRQFAQMLVKDHRAMNAELQKCCDMMTSEGKAKQGKTAQSPAPMAASALSSKTVLGRCAG